MTDRESSETDSEAMSRPLSDGPLEYFRRVVPRRLGLGGADDAHATPIDELGGR